MRPRTLLVLFVVVAGLAAFIWFYERDLPSSDERRQQANQVLSLEADDVRAVEISRGERRVRLERDGAAGDAETAGGWRLVAPLASRADAAAVDGLIASLAGLEKSRTLEDVDAAAVGLERPRASIKLETGSGEVRLLVGGEVPASGDMIVGREGESVAFVVSADVWSDLDKDAGEWRSRDVFHGSRREIERLRLTRGALDVVLARRDGRFWLESPRADLADEDRVNALLGKIEALRVDRFVEPDERAPGELGLEPPAAVVEIQRADGGSFRLDLGDPVADEEGKRYCRAEGQVFVATRPLGDALERPAEEWQSQTWTPFEAYQIDSVAVESDGGEVVFERQGGDWKRGEDTVPYNAMNDLLYAISGAAAERLLSPDEAASLGVERERPRLTLRLSSGDETETLQLFAAVEGGRPGSASGREYLLLFPEATLSDLEIKLEEARSAVVPSADDGPPENG